MGSPDSQLAARAATGDTAILATTFVDNAGVTRAKAVPAGRAERAAQHGIGLSSTFAVFAVDDHLAFVEGFDTPTGDIRLHPQLDAQVPLHGSPGWAWAPAEQRDQDGDVLPTCQRSALRRQVEAAEALGLRFKTTFEVEFTLLDGDGAPLHRGPGYSPFALLPAEALLTELLAALEAQGVPVDQLHSEYSDGQYELSVAAADPVVAADRYVLLRWTIRRLAHRHGLRATFSPMVVPGAVGNGCHLHFSAWRDGRNLTTGGDGPGGLTLEGEHLAAGVLRALPELIAIFAPSALSYARLQPSLWSGAFTCWGQENREAPLRLLRGSRGIRADAANFELKTVDGAANPYLAEAALLGAALHGRGEGLRLPPGVLVDPATLGDDERAAAGIERLPASLGDAVERLAGSAVAREALGDDLHRVFTAVRRYEWERYGELELERAVEEHLWRYG